MASTAVSRVELKRWSRFAEAVPGTSLCLLFAAAANLLEWVERMVFGRAWVEALVLAILAGTAARSVWTPGPRWDEGIAFSAKYLLEVAVVLLGVSVSTATMLAAGPALLVGIAVVVASAIGASFAIGRLLGLPTRMALLVACGNSICGNSAIAAIAPVIGADGDDVATAIAFTAIFGVAVVLVLPVLGIAWGLSGIAYGAFAGLTVYAVPQVIAAASPLGASAVQMGTLVKLVRVLMLGPVCLALSIVAPRLTPADRIGTAERTVLRRSGLSHFVPWFIIGFLAMAACRSLGLVPTSLLGAIAHAATLLTVISMAALGLGVDVRTVTRAGARAIVAVILSLAALGAASLILLRLLRLA